MPGTLYFVTALRAGLIVNGIDVRGASGLFFSTDDCQASYEELKKRGVEFAQEPTEQPYGIDAGFRDPSGNHFRIAQMK